MSTSSPHQRSAIAIGAGPANLSFAALAQTVDGLRVDILERQRSLGWHRGLLVEGASMQTNPMKDLATLVDPTSPFTFTSYLKDKRRLYRAIVCGMDAISRHEFEDYLRWAAAKLPNIALGEAVEAVEVQGDGFRVRSTTGTYRTRNVVVGIGRSPSLPDFVGRGLGGDVFHSSQFLSEPRSFEGKRVVVVGAGQSGSEIFYELLKGSCGRPSAVHWICRRANIFSLEDSPFINEWFFPQHSIWFQRQESEHRRALLADQVFASDGVSASTLRAIYRLLYARTVDAGGSAAATTISVDTSVEDMARERGGWALSLRERRTGRRSEIDCDVVILCTGYRSTFPSFLEPLLPRLEVDGARPDGQGIPIRGDFSVQLDVPRDCGLYIQNGSVDRHGIADPNLSLIAWRSATIINSIMGRAVYDCQEVSGALSWTSGPDASSARSASLSSREADNAPTSALC